MSKKFYSHRDEAGMARLFAQRYGMERVFDPADADIIIWNGGADIATSLYGEKPVAVGIPEHLSPRDEEEVSLFEKYRNDATKLLIGVCRGGQLLNVLNGGKLYQDVNGHGGDHLMIDTRTNEIITVTSTHHQQFRPNHATANVIGLSSESTFKNSASGSGAVVKTDNLLKGHDVEIVWYPDTRSLCIQGHPEYVPNSRFAEYTLELINEFFPTKAA